jgi:cobalt-zinc-cadmium efflux system outer membrane protein
MDKLTNSILLVLFIASGMRFGAASGPPLAPASQIDAALSSRGNPGTVSASTPAAPVPGITPLSALIREAESHNPQILAARRAWQAAEQVPSQVSTLPDPEIMVEHMSAGTPIPFWDFNTVEMTFLGFGISQSLPYPGKLRLRGQIANREAAAAGDDVEMVGREVDEQLRAAYFHLSYIQQALAIEHRDQKLLDEVEKIAEARYRVGQGNQQDVLKAQLEETRVLRDLAVLNQESDTVEAQLKQILDRPPASPDIVAGTLTETPLPYGSTELLARVRAGNPNVAAGQQLVRSRSLGVELARKDFYPDFNVQYMWEHTGAPFPDRYALSIGINIPIYHSRRQEPELAEAAEELNQSRRQYEAQVQQAYFEVKDQYLAAQTDAHVLTIYRQGLIPQATATFNAGLAAYQTGREDFQTLLDSFLDVLNLDLEYWRTLANHETALARLEQLTGITLP